MKYTWINKNDNDKLIVFFHGWGMDENSLVHLDYEGFDVLVVFNYQRLISLEFIDSTQYKEKFLIGFSYGVFIANFNMEELKDYFKIAINGSNYPIDNKLGIPEKVFRLTMNNLSPKTIETFQKRMFNSNQYFQQFVNQYSSRNISDQISELEFIEEAAKREVENKLVWDCAYLSDDDKIFQKENLLNSFHNTKTKIFSYGHFPFYYFNSWKEIITKSDN